MCAIHLVWSEKAVWSSSRAPTRPSSQTIVLSDLSLCFGVLLPSSRLRTESSQYLNVSTAVTITKQMGRYHSTFAPFRASALSIASGLSSPKSPLTIKPPKFKSTKKCRRSVTSPGLRSFQNLELNVKTEDGKGEESATKKDMKEQGQQIVEPEPWLWQCHRCQTRYRLGTSRRCLHDGHFFCGGTTTDSQGRIKRHEACGSEFDYAGWEKVLLARQQRARNSARKRDGRTEIERHCTELCIYPSACHWRIKEEAEAAAAASIASVAQEAEVEAKHLQVHVLPSPNPYQNQHEARQVASFDFLPPDRKGNGAEDEDEDEGEFSSTDPTLLAIDPAKEKRKSASSAFTQFWVKTAAQLGGLLSSSILEVDAMRRSTSSSRGVEGTGLDLPVFKRLRDREREEAMILGGGGRREEDGEADEDEDIDMTDLVSPVSEESLESGGSSSDEEVEWDGVGRAYGGWRVNR